MDEEFMRSLIEKEDLCRIQCQEQYTTEKNQSDGHEIPLAQR